MAKWQKGQSGNPTGRPKGSKNHLSILISLVATLLTSSPAFGAKEIFERTKPHVNVGVQSRYPSLEYQSPLYREAYINKAGQPQRNLVVNKLRGAIKLSESVPLIRDIKSMNDELDNMDGGYISHLRVARDAEGGHAPGELFDGQYFINKSTHSTEQSNEPINGLWVDSDSDGYGDDTGTPSVPSRRAIRVGDVILDGFQLTWDETISEPYGPASGRDVNEFLDSIDLIYPGTKADYMSRQASRTTRDHNDTEWDSPEYRDSDSNGDGGLVGIDTDQETVSPPPIYTGRTVTPAYIENTQGMREYALKLKMMGVRGGRDDGWANYMQISCTDLDRKTCN